jgi:hypothetical protein
MQDTEKIQEDARVREESWQRLRGILKEASPNLEAGRPISAPSEVVSTT